MLKYLLLLLLLVIGGCAEKPSTTSQSPPVTVSHLRKEPSVASYHSYYHSTKKSAKLTNGWIYQNHTMMRVLFVDHYFELNSTKLKSSSRASLQQIGSEVKARLAQLPYAVVYVQGYTDQVYDRRTQQQLSAQYARVVAAYLWSAGTPASRIQVQGLGNVNPIASNAYPHGSAYNRRVVILIRM